VAEVLRRFEQSLDLFPAQNDRQFLFIPGQRNPFYVDLPVQGVAVEKTQCSNGLNVGREFDFPFLEQVKLVRSDFFRAKLVGRFIEVFGECRYRADIALDGRGRAVPDVEIVEHPLSQYSHG
jgi:hypothetical protein